MSDTPQLLLAHHLTTLKLPTFLSEYDKIARHAHLLTVYLFLGGGPELADGAGTCARWGFQL